MEKIGEEISKQYDFKSIKQLPLSFQEIVTSGYYGDIYIGSSDKYDPKNASKKVVIKLMHDTKYNRQDINRLRKVQYILNAGICPHFPILYGVFRINNVKFKGIYGNGVTKLNNISERIQRGPAIGYLMENLGNMTLENYIYKKPNKIELKQILFQCFVGIYSLIKYAHMNHGDFHFKNIMMLKLKKPVDYVYYIDNVKYKVKAKSYCPVIIDINGNEPNTKIRQMKDIRVICNQIKSFVPEIWNNMDISFESSTIKKFFEHNFHEYKHSYNFNSEISNNVRLNNKSEFTFL
jgi:hypothetical protein